MCAGVTVVIAISLQLAYKAKRVDNNMVNNNKKNYTAELML